MKLAVRLFCALCLSFAPAAALAASNPTPGPAPGFSVDARLLLHAYKALVEQHLGSLSNELKAVSSGEDAASGDWTRIRAPLSRMVEGQALQAAVWFARPDGSYATVEKGLMPERVADRAYFPRLMGGRAVDGDLVVSRSTGKKAVVVAVPILAGGKVVGALGVSVSVEKLSALVDQKMKLPPTLVFYALDASGRTAIHRDSALMFEFPSEIGGPSLKSAVTVMLSKPEGEVSYDFRGVRKTVVFERSDMTGWVFALGRSAAGGR